MVELALNYDGGNGLVSTRELAEHQRVSPKYLESLLAALRSAGLVRGVRGAKGGHTLSRLPVQINLREIYGVFEGAEGFVACPTEAESCDGPDKCVSHEVWSRAYEAFVEILESTTLEELANRAREKGEAQPAT
jgi:Rrf2 family protein